MKNKIISLLKDSKIEDGRNYREVLFNEGDRFFVEEEIFNKEKGDMFCVDDVMNCDSYILYKSDEGEVWEFVK